MAKKPLIFVCLASLTTFSEAISLSSFTPQNVNLPPFCEGAYTTPIAGCQVSDFQPGPCSQFCLNGLVEINRMVSRDCQDAIVPDTSMIGLFKAGKGIQVLCNIAVVTTTTTGPAVGATVSIGQSTMVLSSVAPVPGGLLTDTSPVSPQQTNQPNVVPPAQPSVQSSIPQVPVAGTTIQISPTLLGGASTDSGTNSATGLPQGPQGGSTGGGSPFDVTGNSLASRLHQSHGLNLVSLVATGILVSLPFWL